MPPSLTSLHLPIIAMSWLVFCLRSGNISSINTSLYYSVFVRHVCSPYTASSILYPPPILSILHRVFGPVHKGANHIPKAVSDRDLLPDWVRDLNYLRSQALQTSSQSQTGSAHCEVIFCSDCAVCVDWPMQGFAHAQITFRKSFAFTCPQN